MASFMRVETDDGRTVDVLLGGSQITLDESLEDILAVVVARLRAWNKAQPARPKSLAITHVEEATLWLHAYSEGRAR